MNKRQRKKNAAKAAAKRTALLIADMVEYQTPPDCVDLRRINDAICKSLGVPAACMDTRPGLCDTKSD